MLCQNIRKIDRTVKIYISGWGGSPEFILNGGKSVEGVLFVQNIDYSNTHKEYIAFVEKYTQRFGFPPNHGAVFSYELSHILIDALKGGARTSGAIRRAIIMHGKYAGLQYDFSIDRFGDGDRPYFLTVVNNGKFVRL